MTPPGDLFGDMPTLPPAFEPTRDDELLAALVAGAPLPPEAPVEARLVADLFATLTGPSSPAENAGLEAARRAFRAENPDAIRPVAFVPVDYRPVPHRVERAGRRPTRTRRHGRLVAASVLGLLGLGGFAGAAFAGVLPDAIQTVAHRLVGAPSPESSTHRSGHATAPRTGSSSSASGAGTTHTTGPSATGPAAYGLCTAFNRSSAPGSDGRAAYLHSRAYASLVATSGGADKVAGYCATVPAPSADAPGAAKGSGGPSASTGGGNSNGRPTETGRPSDAPSHPVHPTHPGSTSTATSGAPSSDPAPSSTKAHPSHTKTPPKGAHSSHGKAAGSTPTQ